MKIGYLTGMIPARLHNGTEIATRAVANAVVAAGHKLDFIGYSRDTDPALDKFRVVLNDKRPIEFSEAPRLTAAKWAARSLLFNEPMSVAKYSGGIAAIDMPKVAARYDAILVDKPQLAKIHARALEGVKISVVWHAIEHVTYHAVAKTSLGVKRAIYRREASLCKSLEIDIVRRADHIFALTDKDAQTLRDIGYEREITVVPLVVPRVTPPATEQEWDVALLGAWTWSANSDGLRWFLDKVVTLLPSHYRVVVGGHGSQHIRPLPKNVTCVGPVDDSKRFLSSARSVAIPILSGTGISMKVLEACAQGWPTVTTHVGARGIEDRPRFLCVADEPIKFAQELINQIEAGNQEKATREQDGLDWYERRIRTLQDQVRLALERI